MLRDVTDGVPSMGTVLAGKYRLERVLGVGGMGTVVAATHMALDEPVAIKFLLAELAKNELVVARFQREAWAAAKIKNDHIATVSDVATLDDGTPYMVMEFLEGEDLGSLIERQTIPPAQAIDYLLQASRGLAVAHRLNIVHRDIKPENLFLTRLADGSPRVKVLDFGISKISSAVNLTDTSALMGSPLYMAPEQLVSAKDVDARADIWALGVVLYEMLAGAGPFVRDTLPEICTAILQTAPPPLPATVPAELSAIVVRCLAKDRDERFQDLGGLSAALAPFGGSDSSASHAFIARVLDADAASSTAGLQAAAPSTPGELAPTALSTDTPAAAVAKTAAAVGAATLEPVSQLPGAKRSRLGIGVVLVAAGLAAATALAVLVSDDDASQATTTAPTNTLATAHTDDLPEPAGAVSANATASASASTAAPADSAKPSLRRAPPTSKTPPASTPTRPVPPQKPTKPSDPWKVMTKDR